MPGSDGQGIFVNLNKSSELRFGLRRSELIFLDLGEANPVCELCGARARWFSQWVDSWRWTNSQHRKILSLSLSLSLSSCRKPKLKEGNKSFVPEPRESSVFRVFSDYYAYEHSMNICTFHISVSWLCYKTTILDLTVLNNKVLYKTSFVFCTVTNLKGIMSRIHCAIFVLL